MKYCRNCGKEIKEGIVSCPHCGFQVQEQNNAANNAKINSSMNQNSYANVAQNTYKNGNQNIYANSNQFANIPIINYNPTFSYQPISMWGYFGYNILFIIPVVGLIFVLIYSLGGTRNINLRNYARSYLCILILFVVLFALIVGSGFIMGILINL